MLDSYYTFYDGNLKSRSINISIMRSMLNTFQSTQQAKRHIMQAIEHESQKRYNHAMLDLNSAIMLSAKNYDAYLLRGKVLMQQGKYTNALEDFNNAIKIDRKNWDGWNCKGSALYALAKYEQALKAFDEAIKRDKSIALLHMHKGNVLGTCGKAADAIKSYNVALSLDPQNALVHLNKGALLYKTDCVSEASDYFEQAVELDSQDACAHMFRGKILAMEHYEDLALEHYETGFKLNVKYPWYYYPPFCSKYYAVFQYDMRRYFDEVCKNDSIFTDKVQSLLSLSLYTKAKDMLDLCHEVNYDLNSKAYIHYLQSFLFYKTDKYHDALKEIEKSIMIGPQSVSIYCVHKGLILEQLGKYQESLIEYEKAKAKENFKHNASYYQAYSRILYNLNRVQEALDAINISIKLDNGDAYSYLHKGNILQFLDRYHDAIKQYDKATTLDVWKEKAWLGKINALLKLKNGEDALKHTKYFLYQHKMLSLDLLEISQLDKQCSAWYQGFMVRMLNLSLRIFKWFCINFILTYMIMRKSHTRYMHAKSYLQNLWNRIFKPRSTQHLNAIICDNSYVVDKKAKDYKSNTNKTRLV